MSTLYYLFKDFCLFIHCLLTPHQHLLVDKLIHRKRYKICMQCPNKRKKLGMYRCDICGCFLKLKTSFSFESCPDAPERWSIEETE
jgi:hypothetical protein